MQEKNFDISFGQIFKVALKSWWIILIATVVCAGAMFGYSKLFTTPTYTSTATIGVTSSMNAYQDTIMGQTVANDCAHLIKGNETLSEAARMLNAYYEELAKNEGVVPPRVYSDTVLKGMVNANPVAETRYFNVVVKTNAESIQINEQGLTQKQADEAREKAAREEARIVCDFVIAAFERRFQDGSIIEGAKVHTVDSPKLGAESSASLITNTLLGALIGIVLSWGTMIIISFFNDTIESEDWLVNSFKEKMPVLAVIPDATDAQSAYSKYTKKYGYYSGKRK